jgi:hypothetical protein
MFFGQGLIGVAPGFDGGYYFNGSSSANQRAIQTGGCLNFFLMKKFGISPIDADFVRTQGGILGTNTQNNMRQTLNDIEAQF